MGKLIPLILALIGVGAGVGAGVALKPAPQDAAAATCPDPAAGNPAGHETKLVTDPVPIGHDYVKLANQFIVPVLSDGKIKSLVVISLSLEITQGASEQVYAREPKLRDAFLRVMLDHANSGGFDGAFTEDGTLTHLREALNDAARRIMGDVVNEVLILEIARQDK